MELSNSRGQKSFSGRREALLRKRQAIDKEIAAFAAQKEEEYKQFEDSITSGAEADIVPSEIDPALTPELRNLQALRNGGPANEDLEGDDINTQSRTARSIERDDELEKVFGPSFLPLLEKVPRESSRLSAETGSNIRHDIARKNEGGCSTLATLPTSPLPLLSPLRSVSFSAPQGKPIHRRRSSSRSDISVGSLRSSLRDPQQPRSPKRVLFSIDNVVVSPSTSPFQERPTRSHSLPVRAGSAPQSLVVDVRASKFTKDTRGSSRWQKVVPATSIQDIVPPSLSGARANRQRIVSYASDITSNPAQGPLDFTAGDDFENVDIEEDVFGFDDRVNAKKPASTSKFDLDEDFGSDEDRVGDDGITSTSPHAGSLPIEIKWPIRPDPRKV